jgi:hypothetical protein
VAAIRIRCQTDPRPRGEQQTPDANQGDHSVVHVQSSDRVGRIQTHHLFCLYTSPIILDNLNIVSNLII